VFLDDDRPRGLLRFTDPAPSAKALTTRSTSP